MIRSSNIFFSRLFFVCLCVALFIYPTALLAQVEPDGAYFNVIKLDRSDPSMVELTLSGGEGISSEATKVEIIEDGVSQTILQNSVEESALQLAVLIDPRMMETIGTSGQPGYLEMVGVILKLIAATDGMDSSSADGQFAVFSADDDGGLRMIQDWTDDMDRLYSSILKQRSDIVSGNSEPIQDALLASLDIFNETDASTRSTKAVLLFSAGFDGDNLGDEELTRLEEQLLSDQVQVYVAQMAPADQPVLVDESLSSLSSGTNGYLMTVGSEADFTGLFQRIDDASAQQVITYSSDQTPREVNIELTFEDGSVLTKKVNGNGGPFVAAPQTDAVPTVQPAQESVDLVVAIEEEATNTFSIPGTEISIPQNALLAALAALAALLALLAYFISSSSKARRAEQNHQEQMAALYEDAQQQDSVPQHHNFIQSQREPVAIPPVPIQGEQTEASAEQINFDFDDVLQEPIIQEADIEKPSIVIPDVQNSVRRDSIKQDPVIDKAVEPEIIFDKPEPQEPVISKLVKLEPAEQEVVEPESVEKEPANNPTIQQPAIAEPVIIDNPDTEDSGEKNAVEEKPNMDSWGAQPNQINFEQQTFDATIDLNKNRFETIKSRAKMPTTHADHSEVPIAAQPHNTEALEPIGTRVLLGYFVRVTEEQNLPLRLPLYEEEGSDTDDLPQVRIGRNGKVNEIVINAKRVSREHAILIQKENGLYLRDNNSSLGTYLNWHKLRDGEELLLKNNDLVGFGDISYELRLQEDQKDTRG